MMSRITLHLRKQIRSREIDTDLISLKTFTRSMPRFRSDGTHHTHTTGDVSVMVQESAVVHDDRGNVLSMYDDDSDDTVDRRVDKQKDRPAGQDWYDLRPPAPVRLHRKAKEGRDDSTVVRFV